MLFNYLFFFYLIIKIYIHTYIYINTIIWKIRKIIILISIFIQNFLYYSIFNFNNFLIKLSNKLFYTYKYNI